MSWICRKIGLSALRGLADTDPQRTAIVSRHRRWQVKVCSMWMHQLSSVCSLPSCAMFFVDEFCFYKQWLLYIITIIYNWTIVPHCSSFYHRSKPAKSRHCGRLGVEVRVQKTEFCSSSWMPFDVVNTYFCTFGQNDVPPNQDTHLGENLSHSQCRREEVFSLSCRKMSPSKWSRKKMPSVRSLGRRNMSTWPDCHESQDRVVFSL